MKFHGTLLPVIPWLLILPILYSAFKDGKRAAPIAIPSIMALNLRTMGFFSKPSGNCGNSLVSIGVWFMLVGVFSGGKGVVVSSFVGCGLLALRKPNRLLDTIKIGS